MRALVLVAHYDDEVLSCGGWILKHREKVEIDIVAITIKDKVWKQRFLSVGQALGVNKVVSLDLPLWSVPSKKELVTFKEERVLKALAAAKIKPLSYDLLLTHGEDGDIDFHAQHKQVWKMTQKLNAHRMHFVAFPRLGLKPGHKLYKWTEARRPWHGCFLKGKLSPELRRKTNCIVKLSKKIVEKKQQIFKMYFPKNIDYVCVQYPMELFYEVGK